MNSYGLNVLVTIGGRPTAFDRMLATRFGISAVEALSEGKSGVIMALDDTSIVSRDNGGGYR